MDNTYPLPDLVFHLNLSTNIFSLFFLQQVLAGLARLGGRVVIPPVVKYAINHLNNPKLTQVSEEDFAIFNTPEGTLYNQSVVEE